MPKSPFRFRVDRAVAGLAVVLIGMFAACEDDTGPGPLPSNIQIVSGDGQYSKQGTELEEPIVAQVTLDDGQPGAGVGVRFVVRSGGGTLSRSSANTDSYGRTNVRWTLGPTLGTQELTIELADNGEVEKVAQATSANFHCPEEDPTFVQRFTPTNDLFLFTRKSSVIAGAGPERAGIVQLGMDTSNLKFDATSIVGFDESALIAVVRDCAFSASGEFYVSWTNTSGRREIAKMNPNRSMEHFATLPGIVGAEITSLEGGVLAGCDEFGPFTVGCRDTLTRYSDATFAGTGADQANNDAVAYDKDGNFLYFINETGRRLMRVPLDGYTQTGATEEIPTVLTPDEAVGANGMVVHNGTVYILVESTNTKSIVAVTSAGVKSTAFDFTSRGSGNAAGVQNDLALWVQGSLVALYTLDTFNNVIVLCQVAPVQQIVAVDPDSNTDPEAASKTSGSGERVGLAVLPGS